MTMTMMMGEVNQKRIKTNGIWMNIAEKGTGPLVLLLHGFPEFWFPWCHQITHLANHGYHAVAPDLRGFGDSDSPISPSSYTIFSTSSATSSASLITLVSNSNWELLAPRQGSKVSVPAKLIVGNKEIGFDCGGTKEYLQGATATFKSLVPNNEVVILDRHHFIHQEKAQEVSDEILSFISKFSIAD